MIEITCPQCGEAYHADAVHVGKRIRCTKCGSLLPILDAGGTIVQKAPEANTVRPSRTWAKTSPVPTNPHRNAVGLGLIFVLVVVMAVGLGILLRHSSPDKGITSALRPGDPAYWQITPPPGDGASQSSLETTGGAWRPAVNPDNLPLVGQQPLTIKSNGPPCDTQAMGSSMANGSRIVPDVGTNGHGVLEVQNGTNEDAVLSLYDSAADQTIREVYIHAKHSVRMKGIPEGTYQLVYAAGLDWDDSADIFLCDPDYAQFERNFTFTEEEDQEGIQYHSITVTLHPVVGGNVRTKKIS